MSVALDVHGSTGSGASVPADRLASARSTARYLPYGVRPKRESCARRPEDYQAERLVSALGNRPGGMV